MKWQVIHIGGAVLVLVCLAHLRCSTSGTCQTWQGTLSKIITGQSEAGYVIMAAGLILREAFSVLLRSICFGDPFYHVSGDHFVV